MFFGGGGPSTEEVMKDEFKKQKKFIEEQFKKQKKLMETLFTKTQVENVKSRALGVLEAMESRYEFISPYEDVTSCLDEEVINQITLRVEYFMDESDAASVKHAFNDICPEVIKKVEAEDSQLVCGFLLHTYMMIEIKRHEILTALLGLLANSEKYEALSIGYLNVQEHQKQTLSDWLSNELGVRTFCGLFLYHKAMWNGKERQLNETVDALRRYAPELIRKNLDDCVETGNI